MRSKKLVSLFVMFLFGCTSQTSSTPSKTPGTFAIDFDYKKVTHLAIAKSDPQSDDRWAAELSYQNEDWTITSAPQGKPLVDQRADDNFVFHLLDTLRTLQVSDRAGNGPPKSFGLDPPVFAFRLKIVQSDQTSRTQEIKIGQFMNEGARTYAVFDQDPQVYIVGGAALRMLAYISSFDVLRRRTLLTLPADEYDEFEVKHSAQSLFYAQRHNDSWAGRKNEKLKFDAGKWLESVSHLRIKRFIDDANELAQAAQTLERSKPYQVILKDRLGKSTELRVSTQGLASITSRPKAIFELYPEAMKTFMVRFR